MTIISRILLLGILSFATQSLSSTIDGVAFRKLVRDIVAATDSPVDSLNTNLKNAILTNRKGVQAAISTNNIEQLLAEAGFNSSFLVSKQHIALAQLSSIFSQMALHLSASNPDSWTQTKFEQTVDHVVNEGTAKIVKQTLDKELGKLAISKHPTFNRLFDSETGLKMSDVQSEKLIKTELPKYYDSLPVSEKKRIVVGLLSLNPKATEYQQIETVLQESGPLVQKIFQLMKDSVSNPELAKVFTRVQSQVKPFPFEQIKSTLEKQLGPLERAFKSFNPNPLASGTIGQIHEAELWSGESVVVKVRRPHVRSRMKSDLSTLKRTVKDPTILPVIEKMYKSVWSETYFSKEAEFLKEGEIYINRKKGISIAKLHPKFPPNDSVLVLEKAQGENLNEFFNDDLNTLKRKGKAIERLSDIWFRHAIYESGFFHGDLHGGNLFYRANVDSRVGYLLTVIDFGNANHLSIAERKGFVKLSIAAFLEGEFAATEAILEMLSISQKERPLVEKLVQESFAKAETVSDRLTNTILNIEKSKFSLPEAFVSFGRARLFIEEALKRINAEIEKRGGKKKFSSFNAFKWTTVKQMFRHLPWNQKVLSFYFFSSVAGSNCKNLAERMIHKIPGRSWFLSSP